MDKFEDFTYGLKGYLTWIMIFGFCFFLVISSLSTYVFFIIKKEVSEDLIVSLLGTTCMYLLVLWMASAIKFARETIQELYIDDDCLSGYFYFRYQFEFHFADIASVKDYKVTWAMSRTRTFPQGGMAMQITLKNGATYFISPHMKKFNELRELLMDRVGNS